MAGDQAEGASTTPSAEDIEPISQFGVLFVGFVLGAVSIILWQIFLFAVVL